MAEQSRDLKLRTKEFALRVIRMYSKLPKTDTVAEVLGKQVLRSGTSVGANYREASRGRSKAEFISKLGVAEEEADESELWIELAMEHKLIPPRRLAPLHKEAGELTAILAASRKTASGH